MAAAPVKELLSVGVAGACDPELRVGDVVRAGIVIDGRSGERFADSQHRQVVVTVDAVAGVDEKQRLFAEYGAAAVDMEAATVARMAQELGLEFGAIKAISDEVDFEMETLRRFATADGQFREAAFALHVAVRPWMWGRVIALGRNSSKAVAALTAEMRRTLDWYGKRSGRDGTANGE
jgi:adenosylhomocysteine nucleosidase